MSAETALRAEQERNYIDWLVNNGLHADRCDAALRRLKLFRPLAIASPESRSLDVETLAHAIRIWTRRLDRGLIEGDAESVAAEYDRLREHPEGDPR